MVISDRPPSIFRLSDKRYFISFPWDRTVVTSVPDIVW
jgi:hypothetical protein